MTILERLEQRQLLSLTPAAIEFRVNSFTTGDQFAPAVASDRAGNFVVVWTSDGQDGSVQGIYAQRYAATGAPIGAEFRVNTITSGVQAQPDVAMDADGDFVVVWTSESTPGGSAQDVVARRYSAAGVAQDAAEFRVNTFTTGNQESPAVAVDAAGNFIVAWDSNAQDGSSFGVYGRKFSAAGVALTGEIQVAQTTAGLQADPAVAMDDDGDFVIAWTSGTLAGATQYDIYARRFNSAAAPVADEFLVNSSPGFSADFQTFPAVALDANGDFVVAWNSYGQDGSQYGVYARRYSSAGFALDAGFRVNTFTAGQQSNVALDISAAGEFTIVWSSAAQDGSGRGVFAQSYGASGALDGPEFRVNTTTVNHQSRPAIALNADGDAVVVWQDGSSAIGGSGADGSGYGVYAQRYAHPPTVLASSFQFLTEQAVAISFSEDVSASFTAADVIVQNLTTSTTVPPSQMSVSYSMATNTATITFPGFSSEILPNGNYRVTVLGAGITDAAGNAMVGTHVLDFFVLAGDANRDRKVDITDLGILATNWQQSPRDWSQGDFDYSGLVDITDLGILATHWQAQLAAPAPALSGAARAVPARSTSVRVAAQVLR